MLKYTEVVIGLAEIPDEITLCINLSNCPCHCEECHSSYLAEDIGEVLTVTRIEKLLKQNEGITAICFMGGDNDPKLINHYAKFIKQLYVRKAESARKTNEVLNLPKGNTVTGLNLGVMAPTPVKVGWYSGRQELPKEIDINNFDYIKLGPYIREKGPLNCRTTNQKFYKVVHTSMGTSKMYDITHKFWRNETED